MVATAASAPSRAEVQALLDQVFDPEIPVLTVTDLGVIRGIEITPGHIRITLTPTYSGCPAMNTIEQDIRAILASTGCSVEIDTVYAPAWTSDWISDAGREKMRAYGIAPPEQGTHSKKVLMGADPTIACPHCASTQTRLISEFGSTACKAMYHCDDCLQPFDYFKCI